MHLKQQKCEKMQHIDINAMWCWL